LAWSLTESGFDCRLADSFAAVAEVAALVFLDDGSSDAVILRALSTGLDDEIPRIRLGDSEPCLGDRRLTEPWLELPGDASAATVATALNAFRLARRGQLRIERELALTRRVTDGVQRQLTRYSEELQQAAAVQQDFLPTMPHPIDGLGFAALWRPAAAVSGDLFDVIRLDETRVGLFLADAVGHGLPAALLAMLLCRALETKDVHGPVERVLPPGEALARLNSLMSSRQGCSGRYAAAIYAILDCRARTLAVASAGGPAPIIVAPDRPTRVLSSAGPLLGRGAHTDYEELLVEIAPGDRILLHSDGFEVAFRDPEDEADAPAGSAIPRYVSELERLLRSADPEAAVAAVAERLDAECGSLHPHDDCTLLLVQDYGRSIARAA
jgi:sigma-B regulation protein RsbU (phosphoserine phosphatase)